MTIVDTNILIYDTFKDTAHHKEARKLLDSLPKWNIPSIVLIEFIAFLNRIRLGRSDMLSKLNELANNPKFNLVEIEKEDLLEALKTVGEEKISTLRLNDKIILSIAKRLGEDLATFDKKLREESKRGNVAIAIDSSFKDVAT